MGVPLLDIQAEYQAYGPGATKVLVVLYGSRYSGTNPSINDQDPSKACPRARTSWLDLLSEFLSSEESSDGD